MSERKRAAPWFRTERDEDLARAARRLRDLLGAIDPILTMSPFAPFMEARVLVGPGQRRDDPPNTLVCREDRSERWWSGTYPLARMPWMP